MTGWSTKIRSKAFLHSRVKPGPRALVNNLSLITLTHRQIRMMRTSRENMASSHHASRYTKLLIIPPYVLLHFKASACPTCSVADTPPKKKQFLASSQNKSLNILQVFHLHGTIRRRSIFTSLSTHEVRGPGHATARRSEVRK